MFFLLVYYLYKAKDFNKTFIHTPYTLVIFNPFVTLSYSLSSFLTFSFVLVWLLFL